MILNVKRKFLLPILLIRVYFFGFFNILFLFAFFFLQCVHFFFSKRGKKGEIKYWLGKFFSNKVNKQLLNIDISYLKFDFIIFLIFSFILTSNYLGLLIFLPQNFLGKLSLSLLFISLRMWIFSYLPIFFKQKEKLSLFLVGEIKFPTLSLLLSNIEILTHLFRPVTLTARLWVNIWVGHLIIRGLSFIGSYSILNKNLLGFFKRFLFSRSFFIFETIIIRLQTFVFSYLVRVYFKENYHFRNTKLNE